MNTEEIRLITIRAAADVDKAVADINKLSAAQDGLTVVSDKSSRATTSVRNALESQSRSVDANYRAQNQYNTAQLAFTRGLNEKMISEDRYNQLSELNTKRLKDATGAHSVLEKAMSGVQGQLVALSAGAGPVGVFLAGLGPWGMAAAAGLGVTTEALHFMNDEAKRMGELARMLRDSAQTIGINTDQMQALNMVAAASGVQTDKNTLAFERFTVQLNELRKGTGTLFTELMTVDQGLVRQLAGTKDVTAAIDLLAASYEIGRAHV